MDFDLRFTDKEITAWGGMAIMKRMLDHLGFDAALSAADLPQPGSNRGYRPEQLITQFMLSIRHHSRQGIACLGMRGNQGQATFITPAILVSQIRYIVRIQ